MPRLSNSLYAYDISNNKQRRRALKQLRKVADVYQDSVFDCRLAKQAHQVLQVSLLQLLQPGEQVVYLALPANCDIEQLGSGMQPLGEFSLVIS